VNPREAGLAAADRNEWPTALLLLNQAARRGALDPVVLDAFGEAAYHTGAPEALGPYQNHYKYPTISTQMARAFLMLGDEESCREFLGYAKDSALKFAILALLNLNEDIEGVGDFFVRVAEEYPGLYYPEFWRALAAVADAIGRNDLARLAERRSKSFAYTDPNVHFNQALRYLTNGELRAGWRLYDWRLVPGAHQSNRTEFGDISLWEGESLRRKTLLVYLEQGLGDGIFGLRYLRYLQERGARIEIVARGPLIPLVTASFPEARIHSEEEAVVVDYWDHQNTKPSYWTYAFSIPSRGGLYEAIGTEAFIKVPSVRLEKVRQKMHALNPCKLPVYTINWHGRIDTQSDRSRAFTPAEFLKVSGLLKKPCLIVSVQKESTPEEIQVLQKEIEDAGCQFFDAGPELCDFAETAAWVQLSAKLWTCDTSVAHLGGALGHPTTVLVRNKSIWQWRPRVPSNSDQPGTSLWYDSVDVQYAMTPAISWLFRKMNVSTNAKKDQIHERKNPEVQPSDEHSHRQRGTFRFAGR
jgi:hypothetical protein